MRSRSTKWSLKRAAVCGATLLGTTAAIGGGLAASVSAAPPEANLKAAAAELAQYYGHPTFKAPGPPLDAKKIMAGKTIVAIPVLSSNPFTTTFEAAQAKMAKQIGFKFIRWENKGTVAEWAKGIDYAISQHADLIALDGASQPRLLGPQIKKAQSKGIIVIDTHETDVPQGKSPYVDFTIPAPYTQSGRLMADYA